MDDRDFLEQLKTEFIDNLQFDIGSCEELLLKYEKDGSEQHITDLLRVMHSMKGSAHAVEMHDIAAVLHELESHAIQHKTQKNPRTEFVSQILRGMDQTKNKAAAA